MPANRTDPRRFYQSQAIPRTSFGLSVESGPSGYNTRLIGIPRYDITVKAQADEAGVQVFGDLPEGAVLMGITNHNALAAGTALIELPAHAGEDAVELGTALDLTDAGPLTLTGLTYTPLTKSRPIQITVTGGSAGAEVILTLQVAVIDNAWY